MTKRTQLYRLGYKFLVDKIGQDALDIELDYYTNIDVDTLNDVYERLLVSMQNRQGYMRFLAPVQEMEDILYGFDGRKVFTEYENNIELLFNTLDERFPDKKFDIGNKRSAWYQYTKGIISGARFIGQFNSIDEFHKFIDSFAANEYTTAALPMVIAEEIHGFGFALACDFLKEIGYVDYGKPDVHLHDIFTGVGLLPDTATDYEVAKEISKMALEVNKINGNQQTPAVIVDKVFWIIGSGRVERGMNRKNIGDIGRQKETFIDAVKAEWSK